MKIPIKSFWPAIGALIGATILFCLPGEDFPEADWFSEISGDKLIHIGLFGGLVTLWSLPFIHKIAVPRKVTTVFIWIALGFVVYGIGIEFIQGAFIANRTFGIDDMVADAIGSAGGFVFAKWQLRKQRG